MNKKDVLETVAGMRKHLEQMEEENRRYNEANKLRHIVSDDGRVTIGNIEGGANNIIIGSTTGDVVYSGKQPYTDEQIAKCKKSLAEMEEYANSLE